LQHHRKRVCSKHSTCCQVKKTVPFILEALQDSDISLKMSDMSEIKSKHIRKEKPLEVAQLLKVAQY